MKFIVACLGVVAAVSAHKETVKLPKVVVDKIHDIAKPCAEKYGVDPNLILKVADGTLPRDDATNNFLLCFTTTAGYMTEDGHLVVDKLASLLQNHPLEEEFKDTIRKCNEVTKETPVATAVAMNTCFADLPPIRFLF